MDWKLQTAGQAFLGPELTDIQIRIRLHFPGEIFMRGFWSEIFGSCLFGTSRCWHLLKTFIVQTHKCRFRKRLKNFFGSGPLPIHLDSMHTRPSVSSVLQSREHIRRISSMDSHVPQALSTGLHVQVTSPIVLVMKLTKRELDNSTTQVALVEAQGPRWNSPLGLCSCPSFSLKNWLTQGSNSNEATLSYWLTF